MKVKKVIHEWKWELLIFLTGATLIYSTYAWFSSSLDVNISDFRMTTNSETGLTISLDGINWGSNVEISKDTIINDLKTTYPGNTNQWSKELGTVSTTGIRDRNSDKFSIYINKDTINKKKKDPNNLMFSPIALLEQEQNDKAEFIAFDIFLKNVTGSPKSDNLYLDEGTKFEIKSEKDNTVINSMRIGMVFMDSISKKSSEAQIQRIDCNNNCTQIIYEPNSTSHSQTTIDLAKEHNILLNDGQYYPTYGVYNGDNKINIWSGIYGSDHELNTEVFKRQETITDFSKPIAKLPDGIMKVRVYIWIEGQDIDIAELVSDGYELTCSINFRKDMAGYE